MSREIFVKDVKKLIHPEFVQKFFSQRLKKYYPQAKAIKNLEIKSVKGFLGLRNLKIKYELTIDFGKRETKKIIHARARKRRHCIYDSPHRHYAFLKYIWQNGFQKNVARPLDYIPQYNLFLYENVAGESFQSFLELSKTRIIFQYLPQMAECLRKLHQLKLKKDLPIKTRYLESYDSKHWLYILKLSYPSSIIKVKNIISELNRIRKNHSCLFGNYRKYTICHGDPHLGNFLKAGQLVSMIDFSEAYVYEPLDDVARFLVQSESMFRYYLPQKFDHLWPKFHQIFIKSYFGQRELTFERKLKIKYFEIRNLIQIFSNLVFLQKEKIYKKEMLDNFNQRTEEKMKEIRELEKCLMTNI